MRFVIKTDLNDAHSVEELEARRAIKEYDKRIANFEIACGSSDDPGTIAGFTRRIEYARSERHGAGIELRRATTGRGMTEVEIRQVAQNLTETVTLLTNASPADGTDRTLVRA